MELDVKNLNFPCQSCGRVGLADGNDGFYYCVHCGSRCEDIVDADIADENFYDASNRGALYQDSHRRAPVASTFDSEPPVTQSQLWATLTQSPKTPNEQHNIYEYNPYSPMADVIGSVGPATLNDFGPTIPDDFGPSAGSRGLSYKDYYNEVRIRYVMGLQIMVQLQCEALTKEFGANPLVNQICGPIWFRYLNASGVFDDDWADETIRDSESQKQGEVKETKPRLKFRAEPHNIHGQRAVMIWYRSLRQRLPLSSSLAISFLACHVAREAILPTDLVQWSIEGKLPYFYAFMEIEKNIGEPSSACPLSTSLMFRPSQSVSSQKLESLAASIAETIGLELPPVNFHRIASRYLRKLSLPEDQILPKALLLQEWSMPPDLWLSSSEWRLPTRVCVMCILIVAIRILYNINGFGVWEKSLCKGACTSISNGDNEDYNQFDAEKLLQKLHAIYDQIDLSYEYSKDLSTYLQYCKDVVFAGLEPSYEDYEEERSIEQLWEFYQKNKDDIEGIVDQDDLNRKRPRESVKCRDCYEENKKLCDHHPSDSQFCDFSMDHKNTCFSGETSTETYMDRAIKELKQEMDENRFLYIPPRKIIKRRDYLHYKRKRDDGAFTYVAHADYYILLRACARMANIDTRLMHWAVLIFEKRLSWLEKRIEECLHMMPPKVSCEFCRTEDKADDDNADDINLSELTL
ncbi:hypothetical protein SAY86_010777 [Trapa natans]|uniref:Rrn7/TAF1B N-terminal cyclin domain-containing protein n=1 Tax=Trapa natans TaxID=22666 RepID=A0AAN7LM71_TRANT|nr:hypothetical protein SAY86_010777 [Trapa natans]